MRMPTYNQVEGEDATDNDVESDGQQTIYTRHRPHLSRTTVKDATETLENETGSGTNEKCMKLVNNQRSSNRLTKRLKRDTSPVDPNLKKSVATKPAAASIGSKTRRPWELWSVEDKNSFFEALCEYGKDFESIQSYIAQRSKKKGIAANMIKNKDQVRHFYYRTWHKISKFLEISECVRKQTQELYGLINYAELRKKIGGCLNEKNRQKLNELVFSGVTTVKHKGKKLRIKTPVCRALKKLNNVSDTKEPETDKLPKDIFVEFRPHTNAAWLHVQNLAHNPRVRTKVCLQKRLKPVIEHLQRRWRPYRLKRREIISSSLPNFVSQDSSCDNPPILRVKPARDAKISPLSMSAVDIASSSDVCLEKHMKLSHKTLCKDINKTKRAIRVNQKISCEKQIDSCENSEKSDILLENATESTDINHQVDLPDTCMKPVPNDVYSVEPLTPPKSVPELDGSLDSVSEAQRSLSLLASMLDNSNRKESPSESMIKSVEENRKCPSPIDTSCRTLNSTSAFPEKTDHSVVGSESILDSTQLKNGMDNNMTLGEFLSLNSKKVAHSPEPLEEKKCIPDGDFNLLKDEENQDNTESIYHKTVRNGWTTEEAGFLTFGELFLLLGKPSTIVLEYEFEQSETPVTNTEENEAPSEMTTMLNKVFEVAQTYFMEPKNKQVSGKQHGRTSNKTSKIKTCLNERAAKDIPNMNASSDANVSCKEVSVNKDAACVNPTTASDNLTPDKHVFVMPVGTAPRNVKPPDQNSLKEEIGKLLPGTRRGCRVRRKPLVVQRPLLPREGMRTISGPRPMTVVHIVPSVSPLTAVIPSSITRAENKINIPSAKKVMKIISPGSSIDMHPIQVPVIKQVHTDPGPNMIIQQSSVPASHVLVNSTSANSIQILSDPNISCRLTPVSSTITTSLIKSQESSAVIESLPIITDSEIATSSTLDALNLDLLSVSSTNSNKYDENFVSFPHISIPETSNPLPSSMSPIASASFLDDFGLTPNKSKLYDSASNTSSLSVDLLPSTPKQSTPPESPAHQPFRINSPEIQWLNGESTELSLNTFLNSMESPCKVTSSSTSANIVAENSNFDSISRLPPVVDSQVRCLLDECSIDFITKFEDLADVINNSSSNESKQT